MFCFGVNTERLKLKDPEWAVIVWLSPAGLWLTPPMAMKFWEAALLVATLASVSAVKQQRVPETWAAEFSQIRFRGTWIQSQSGRSLGIHSLTLLALAVAAVATCAVGLGMFYFQVVRDAEALLKGRKWGHSNAEGTCWYKDSMVYGSHPRKTTIAKSLLDPSQAKLKDVANDGLTQPRTIVVG
ncbi:unnamed protein product [Effrenium voratum]|nr:unnamed protein product [Effrenium voratum]